MIEAVLFDLDDTLYEQRSWLTHAWAAVAQAAAPHGVEPETLRQALAEIAAAGSDRGRIIDRALARVGASDVPVAPLVEAFRASVPPALSAYPQAVESLRTLRRVVPVGLVSDGDPGIQRAKLRLLGLQDAFDVIVLSDELGRERRKPHPAPFQAALTALAVAPSNAVFVGDRPDKDVRGAAAVGMRSVRVLTGEYAAVPDDLEPWRRASDVTEAISMLLALRRSGPRPEVAAEKPV